MIKKIVKKKKKKKIKKKNSIMSPIISVGIVILILLLLRILGTKRVLNALGFLGTSVYACIGRSVADLEDAPKRPIKRNPTPKDQ